MISDNKYYEEKWSSLMSMLSCLGGVVGKKILRVKKIKEIRVRASDTLAS